MISVDEMDRLAGNLIFDKEQLPLALPWK
jgi:hypothetical protein